MHQKDIESRLVPRKSESSIQVSGEYLFEIIRDGKVIDSFVEKNIIVDQGINYILNAALNAEPQSSSWYVGIFEGNYTPVAGDTAATFPASATECVAYAEAARQEFVKNVSTAKSVSNSASKASFSINATKTIYGCFLSSASAKSSTIGTMLSAVRFSAQKGMTSGDILTVSYTVNMASA
jgi:hypothetical protein